MPPDIILRPGTLDDSYAVFIVFEEALADLMRRQGFDEPMSIDDPVELAEMWAERRSLYEHLARTAEHFWVAERAGQVVGYARSILRDGHREFTEFFILPGIQSRGLGRELMARAFPADGATRRSIIATTDMRAQARYLKAGVYPRFPIYYLYRSPEARQVASDLNFEAVAAPAEALPILGEIDLMLFGHRRNVDHAWLLGDRQGFLYLRDGQPVGYGYAGDSNGPFALLDSRDFPAVLAHAESLAASAGRDEFGVEVPMINSTAVDYLLAQGFQLGGFVALFMSDRPFGHFEHYIVTSPPLFL